MPRPKPSIAMILASMGGSSAAPSIPITSGRFTAWSNACSGAARWKNYRLSKPSSPKLQPRSTCRSLRHACAGPGSISPKSAALRRRSSRCGSRLLAMRRGLSAAAEDAAPDGFVPQTNAARDAGIVGGDMDVVRQGDGDAGSVSSTEIQHVIVHERVDVLDDLEHA